MALKTLCALLFGKTDDPVTNSSSLVGWWPGKGNIDLPEGKGPLSDLTL